MNPVRSVRHQDTKQLTGTPVAVDPEGNAVGSGAVTPTRRSHYQVPE